MIDVTLCIWYATSVPDTLQTIQVLGVWKHRKAIAEFRRTHEEAQLAEARSLINQEQWEALLDVVSPAAYYA